MGILKAVSTLYIVGWILNRFLSAGGESLPAETGPVTPEFGKENGFKITVMNGDLVLMIPPAQLPLIPIGSGQVVQDVDFTLFPPGWKVRFRPIRIEWSMVKDIFKGI